MPTPSKKSIKIKPPVVKAEPTAPAHAPAPPPGPTLIAPMVPPGMQVVMRHLSQLQRYPNNPRRNAHAVPVVMKSLREFGWRQPVVLDVKGGNFIVVGDTRFQGAQQLAQNDPAWEWVPTVDASDLTPAQIAAYRLADNRVGEVSEWDDSKLMAELGMIIDEGFDLAGMGFTEDELYEHSKITKKEDTRYLEDFEVMPQPRPKFVLISAPEDKCAEIMSMVQAAGLVGVKMEYSGDPGTGSAKKAAS